jgi:hypothetical protein
LNANDLKGKVLYEPRQAKRDLMTYFADFEFLAVSNCWITGSYRVMKDFQNFVPESAKNSNLTLLIERAPPFCFHLSIIEHKHLKIDF